MVPIRSDANTPIAMAPKASTNHLCNKPVHFLAIILLRKITAVFQKTEYIFYTGEFKIAFITTYKNGILFTAINNKTCIPTNDTC